MEALSHFQPPRPHAIWAFLCPKIHHRKVNALRSTYAFRNVQTYGNPDCLQAFLLDKTVCVEKKVWQATISLSDEVVIRITENAAV